MDIEAEKARASALADQGDLEQAILVLQAALEEAPEDGRLWNNLGLYHCEQSNFGLAEPALLKAIQLSPESWQPKESLLLVRIHQIRMDEALALAQELMAHDNAPGKEYYHETFFFLEKAKQAFKKEEK